MKFRYQILDAISYTLRDWKAIVLLGIILCIASTSEEFQTADLTIYCIISIITVITLIFEEGYRYKIIVNTLKGHNAPPIIGNLKPLLKEGFIELITLYIYGWILWGINFLSDKSYGATYTILVIISFILYFMFLGSAVNKALHGSKFLSGFNIFEIYGLYYKLGLKQSIFLAIIGTISANLIISCVFDLGIFSTAHILDFLTSFFLNPILLLFITRLIALCGKHAISD
jgi:hypothetical protein